MITLFKLEQPLNALSLIVEMELGMSICVRLVQFMNIPGLRLVSLGGILMSVNFLHPAKADSPIDVKLSGSEILVKLVHLRKE